MKSDRERTRRVTVRDVAAAAGVSAMTVSNVINGRNTDVGAETRKRVEEAIRTLNYRPQRGGQGLRSASSNSVGLIIIDPSPAFLSDPFTAAMVSGLSNVMRVADMTLTIQGVSIEALEKSIFIRQLVVDGFCVILSGDAAERKAAIDAIARLQQPFILLQETLPAGVKDACAVREDDEFGGKLIAGHLMARGVSRILLILPKTDWPALEGRSNGLRMAMEAAQYSATFDVLRAEDEEFASVQAALSSHLREHPLPEVIVGGNDRIALAAMALLQDRGHVIPNDIKIVGFNGFEFSRYARPSLTTVLSPAYQIGEKAGELMLERFAGKPFPKRDVVFAVSLSAGQSA